MPKAVISFQVDLEVEYDPFKGKTLEQYTEMVQGDVEDCLWDVRQGELEDVLMTKINAEIKS